MSDPDWKLVNEIRRAGNGRGPINDFFDNAGRWASDQEGADAEAIRTFLAARVVRPFYSAKELTRIWSVMKFAFKWVSRIEQPYSPARMANVLDRCGLPKVLNSYGDFGEFYNPMTNEVAPFYICERVHFWKTFQMNQSQFEYLITGGKLT